jgi:hypothetical protein
MLKQPQLSVAPVHSRRHNSLRLRSTAPIDERVIMQTLLLLLYLDLSQYNVPNNLMRGSLVIPLAARTAVSFNLRLKCMVLPPKGLLLSIPTTFL